MNTNETQSSPGTAGRKQGWLRRNIWSVVIILAITGATVTLFFFQDQLAGLAELGYVGAFLVSVVSNATIVLPMPSLIILLPIGAALNPLYVGLAAGVGGALGEMTAFAAGYSGRGIWRDNKRYQQAVTWLRRWGMAVVFLFAVTPMPIDVMGLAAGNLRFPAWKYFAACLPGKTIKYILLAYAGFYGWEAFLEGGMFFQCVVAVGVGLGGTALLLFLALFAENWAWRRRRTV